MSPSQWAGWCRETRLEVRRAHPKVREESAGSQFGPGGVDRLTVWFGRCREAHPEVREGSEGSAGGKGGVGSPNKGPGNPPVGPGGVEMPTRRSKRPTRRSGRGWEAHPEV